jgi:N-acyl-D-aspartate/D-glutamate deacylase
MMITTTPRKNDQKQAARLQALEEFNEGLKANSLNTKTVKRAIATEDRQRGDRNALVDSKRKGAQKPTNPTEVTMEEAEAIVEEELAAIQDATGLDLSDLTYEQVEALKEYGGLTGNMSKKQVDEIISRVSPLTEDGTPFIISTPRPKGRFLNPRRLRVKDIVTGKEILL